MPHRLHASHRIVVDAPVDQTFMFFTPAGEELWVDGWKPTYVYPSDGRTESGMVFTTGQGDELTIWTLADFDREAHRSRYLRCTPASRTCLVEVRCVTLDKARTEVWVSYTLTALNAAGKQVLEDFEGERFTAMIDDWARKIAGRRELLLATSIR
ncbi:SRPBCC family protein [Ralstonia pickettii]|uniref:SRPBCC family protein n=1 Tax=Ralstonia pickettii TaxID=329 RepID=A0A7X2HN94_RALPI|nr:SRPBCC family protein [Ralstonia pickettii]MRS99669.1 SRPBCC family protein [Ralstonia pickettii]